MPQPRPPFRSWSAVIEPLESRQLLSAAVATVAPSQSSLLAAAALPARQMENLNRGVVAVRANATQVFVSWRLLGLDPANIAFNVYRAANGAAAVKLNGSPLTAGTNYTDGTANFTQTNAYFVRPVVGGVEQSASETHTLPPSTAAAPYITVPMQVPAGGTTPDGVNYTYVANDMSVGDLDGDGDYEYVVKWDPSNAKDNSQSGYTGNVYLDAYQTNGARLWRIDLGRNIRAGAHYTQFMVYDFDGDGKAEIATKTAPGTRDGTGANVILPGHDPNADYRNTSGYVLSGPEYLSVFNGQTGAAMATTNFLVARGTVSNWGDSYGNRVDRFLAGVAYLDGQRPSLVFGRGYYERTTLTAWDWRNGQLTNRWVFDSEDATPDPAYEGQGAHSLSIADVDGDGRDEIIYGAATFDDNGAPLATSGLGHGDALHASDMDPSRPGVEVFQVHEGTGSNGHWGASVRDGATGQVLVQLPVMQNTDGSWPDVGRGVAMDVHPTPGYEFWTISHPDIYNVNGSVVHGRGNAFINFGAWWDGDLYRELLDGTTISKWGIPNGGRTNFDLDPNSSSTFPPNTSSNNGTKSTPGLSGDILGDWREEVIWRRSDSTAFHIYTTTIPTTTRLTTLMHDSQYRVAIAWQNGAYNQPPHPSFFLGNGMATPPPPNIYFPEPTAPPPVDPNVYPAENASFGGGSGFEATNGGFNGTGYVNSSTDGGFLQFNNVDGGATAAMRSINIRFALGAAAPRAGRLIINGVARDVTFSTTGAWNTWQTLTINAPLNAGATNTIRFETTGQDLANIDEIAIDPGVKTGSFSGQVYHDVDANELHTAEPTWGGVTAYIDSNVNGAFDTGELMAVTNGSGSYSFAALPDGNYVVRTMAPAGYVASTVGQPSVSAGGAVNGVHLALARIVYTSADGADNYRLRMNASGKYEILIGGSLAYTVFAAAPSLTFNLGGGDDTLTVDLVNGAPAPSGGLAFDGGAGSDTLAIAGSAAADVVQFNASGVSIGAATLGHSNVDRASFAGGGGFDSVTVNGGPTVSLAAGQQLHSLVLAAGAAASTPAANSFLFTRSLQIGAGARLDLADNDLLVDYDAATPYADVRAHVMTGRGGASGIVTTPTPDNDTILAVVDNAIFGRTTWGGIPIDATTVIGKYTLYGDGNLDGKVTGDDYLTVDANLGVTNAQWSQGDFNFSGTTTGDDYLTIDANLGKDVETLAAVAGSESSSTSSEPEAGGSLIQDVEAEATRTKRRRTPVRP